MDKIIEKLNCNEQKILYNLVDKIKRQGREVDELSIVHNLLKADISIYGEGSSFQEISAITAPSLIKKYGDVEIIQLPKDFIPLTSSFEKVISARSSKRNYTDESISLRELSTLLYYSYGVKGYMPAYNIQKFPLRFAPSSGGLQGVELYIIINEVGSLKKGIYHYNPFDHTIELIEEGYFKRKIVNICVYQEFINNASALIVLSCIMDRLVWKYKVRAYRYIHMNTGFVGENLYLVATALNLGVCAIAGFLDDNMNELLRIDNEKDEFVGLIMAVGKLRKRKDG